MKITIEITPQELAEMSQANNVSYKVNPPQTSNHADQITKVFIDSLKKGRLTL